MAVIVYLQQEGGCGTASAVKHEARCSLVCQNSSLTSAGENRVLCRRGAEAFAGLSLQAQ